MTNTDQSAALLNNRQLVQITRIVVLLCLFVLFDYGYKSLSHPSESDLKNPFLLLRVFQSQHWLVWALVGILLIAVLRFRQFWVAWPELEKGAGLRGFISLLSLVFAFAFALQGYNFYFDQGYYPDRILLLLSAALVYWRPVFVFLFLLLLFPLTGQWNEPLGGYISGTIHHALQALILFCAWFFVSIFSRHRHIQDYIFLLCVIAASVYWVPGLLKFKMNWYEVDQIHFMPIAAYAHGWLAFLSPQQLVSYTNQLIPFEKVLHALVLLIELGALICLWHKRLFLALLLIATVFHFAVFMAYGYMLWAWIIFDISLLILLLRLDSIAKLFTPLHFILSIIFILTATVWLDPPRLAWYNTPLSYSYKYEAIGQSDAHYKLSPRFFAPYGDIITMGNFRFISPGPRLVGPYGNTTELGILHGLRVVKSDEELFSLEERLGENDYDPLKADRLFNFITDYLSHYNMTLAGGMQWRHMTCCTTPPQFWSLDSENTYKGQEPIKRVIVHEVTTFFDGSELKNVRDLKLTTLDIPH